MDAENFQGRSADIERPPIAEINELAAERRAAGDDLVDLGQAVLGLPPPDAALAEARRWLDAGGVHGYSPDPGLPEVREAVAAFCREHKSIADADAAEVMLTCGANQAFANAVLTLTRPGDEVITFGPGYFDHDFALRLAGCVNVEVPLRWGERFTFDIDEVARAVTPRTRAVVLVSPGNPTGAVLDPSGLAKLRDLCEDHGLWLLSDETYDLLTFGRVAHQSPAAFAPRDRVVVIGSFSKVFGLAGWRVGYLLARPAVVEETLKAQDTLVVCAPVPAQRAALGALSEAATFAAKARQTLRARRDCLLSALAPLDWITPAIPDGATFTLARLPPGADDVAVARQLVTDVGVVTVPGSAFGPRGAGALRLSFGNLPEAGLTEAGARLGRFKPSL